MHLDNSLESFVEEWLWAVGALSVSSEPQHVPERKLVALFDQVDQGSFRLLLESAAAPFEGKVDSVAFSSVDAMDWQVKWRENFEPFSIGSFRIMGEWEEGACSDERTVLVYPGQAFGTGQHQTTRLMVKRLSESDLTGKAVLDVGCGTGILALVAESMGARRVFGFDVDPDCDENMRHHLRINHSERVTLAIGSINDFDISGFDLVMANITINVLLEVWPKLAEHLPSGGLILSSGILDCQEDQAVATLQGLGLLVDDIRREGEWIMVEARKP